MCSPRARIRTPSCQAPCASAGEGAVQQVYRLDCNSILVVGFAPLASTWGGQLQASFMLQLLNATVPSPCGDVFAGTNATSTVQIRCALHPSSSGSLQGQHGSCWKPPRHMCRRCLAGSHEGDVRLNLTWLHACPHLMRRST